MSTFSRRFRLPLHAPDAAARARRERTRPTLQAAPLPMRKLNPTPAAPSPLVLNPRVRAGLALLAEARAAAGAAGRDVWEFAVELGELRATGLSGADLRWLLCQGYAEHRWEDTPAGAARRTFRRLRNLSLPERTCFVLTPAGAQVASGQTSAGGPAVTFRGGEPGSPPFPARLPRWDELVRELRWGGLVVKRFRVPAANQEAILAALEEEGWPARIDDPLPRADGVEPKVRLHDAIKGLNRHQVRPLLAFRGDGTGRGVLWAPAASAGPPGDCP